MGEGGSGLEHMNASSRGTDEPTAGWWLALFPRGEQLGLGGGDGNAKHGAAEDGKCQDELGGDLHFERRAMLF